MSLEKGIETNNLNNYQPLENNEKNSCLGLCAIISGVGILQTNCSEEICHNVIGYSIIGFGVIASYLEYKMTCD